MVTEKLSTNDFGGDKMLEQNTVKDQFQQPSNKSSKPLIAGILLMIAGALALVSWISVITMDVSMIDMSVLQELDPTMGIKDFGF